MTEGTYLLGPEFPLLPLLGCAGVAARLVLTGDAVMRRREF